MLEVIDTPQPLNRRPILVPVDFSECSRSALLYACRLVEGTHTPLLILHVVHDSPGKPGVYRRHNGDHPSRPMIDIADEMLDELLTKLHSKNPDLTALKTARTRLIQGLPGARIIEIAAQERAAMILMGTHGRSGIAHFLQGSVAEYVSKHARVPVTTVRENVVMPVKLNLDTSGYAVGSGVQ
ncbi:MAG: universal stress protein [Gammaproteobacteria bacterium]